MKSKMTEMNLNDDTVYDVFAEEKFISLVAGYRHFKRTESGYIPYCIYKGIMYPFQVIVVSMCFVAAVISFGNIAETIQAIHIGFLLSLCVIALSIRLFTERLFKKAVQTIRDGVYNYDEGIFEEEHNNIKKKYVSQIRYMSKLYKYFVGTSVVSNAFLVPVIQGLMADKSSGQRVLNPYLPQPIYMPFNTRTYSGFIVAFIINVSMIVIIGAIVICNDTVFVSCTIQLKAQFEILNFSLQNLEKRAYLCVKKRKLSNQDVNSNYFDYKQFQDCLYKCFRSNIQHHQAIIQLKCMIQDILGFMFLTVIALASFILAAHVILILETPKFHIMFNFVVTLLAEMMYTLHFCWSGEELTSESSEVYYSLYFTPWYNCDIRFKKLLPIMLSNTRAPVKINTPGFNITASLNSFGSIISTVYQVMNVVRNT